MFLHLSVILFTGGGVSAKGRSLSRGWGVSVRGGSVQGDLCPGEVSVEGGICQGDHPRTVKSGRYASYWNTFLFVTYFHNQLLFSSSIQVSIKTMGTRTEW